MNTAAKFATMPRPGIKDGQTARLKAMRLRLFYQAKQLRAAGHSVLAARKEQQLSCITHELMRRRVFS